MVRSIERRSIVCAPIVCALRAQTTNHGDGRIRTDDPLLAKQVLSQLSYAPVSIASRQSPEKTMASSTPL
jgi:hypothetical protein